MAWSATTMASFYSDRHERRQSENQQDGDQRTFEYAECRDASHDGPPKVVLGPLQHRLPELLKQSGTDVIVSLFSPGEICSFHRRLIDEPRLQTK